MRPSPPSSRHIGFIASLAVALACACGDDEAPPSRPQLTFEATGPAPQGGLVDFIVNNVDLAHPFAGPAPVLVSGGVAIRYTEVSPTRLAGVALVDPLAPIGPLRLQVRGQSAQGQLLTYASDPDDPLAPLISLARTPLRLTTGATEPNEALSAPRQSNLYKVAIPEDDQIFVLTFGTVGAALQTVSGPRLVGAMAPSSGKFADGTTFETTFDSAVGSRVAAGLLRRGGGGDAFLAIHSSDLSGAPADYNYSLRLSLAKGTSFKMAERSPPDDGRSPLASIELDGPAYAVDGAIDRAEDSDYVVFTPKRDGRVFVSAAPVGAVGPLNVTIFGNDPGTANCSAFMAGGLGTTQAEVKATAGVTYCARVNSVSKRTLQYQLVITPEL